MTYDPNLPPSSRDDRLRDRDPTASRSSSTGWIIGLIVLAIVVIGAFIVWPDRTANVAGGGPETTGTTTTSPTTPAPAPAPAPAAPAPAQPAPAAPADPAPATPP